jgi:UbiD family decarboxylase
LGRSVFRNLAAFVERLRQDGDLVVVEAPVDPHLEIAEIHRRVIAAGGPALLFSNVPRSDFPIVTNLFGTARRAELAFGGDSLALVREAVQLAEHALPPTPARLWQARHVLRDLLRVGARPSRRPPVLDTQWDEVHLERLPALTSWPQDGGPFLTLPLVLTEHPADGRPNLGLYRMQLHDGQTAGMHWQIGKGGAFHHAAAEERGCALPVAVMLGGPPALTLAAVAPLPEKVSELLLASLLLGEKLPTTRVPGYPAFAAEAEIVLLGHVPPQVRRAEGPFGDHYGYYSLRHDFPVLRVERVAHRRQALFPATVVGKPRQEDFFIGDLLQELLAPLLRLVMPGVRDLWAYGETGYHSLAAAVVRERHRREALTHAFRILGEGQLSLTKFLIVTDRAVDLRDFRATLTHLLERTCPETDLHVFADLAMDTLDYTGPRLNEGSKGVWAGLGDPIRVLPRAFAPAVPPPPDVREALVFAPGCLVLGARTAAEDPAAGPRLAAHPAFADWPLLVVCDEPRRAASDVASFLWSTFTRFEPAADIHARASEIVRNHVVRHPPILIDARRKPGFPEEVTCDAGTAARVTTRWREYFPRGVEMGEAGDARAASD